jgi:hypothetical protein
LARFYRALRVGHIAPWFVAVIFAGTLVIVIGIAIYVGQEDLRRNLRVRQSSFSLADLSSCMMIHVVTQANAKVGLSIVNSPDNAVDPTSRARFTGHDSLCEALRKSWRDYAPPDGCPWDREQTHQSLVPGLLEEAYEVADAIRTS